MGSWQLAIIANFYWQCIMFVTMQWFLTVSNDKEFFGYDFTFSGEYDRGSIAYLLTSQALLLFSDFVAKSVGSPISSSYWCTKYIKLSLSLFFSCTVHRPFLSFSPLSANCSVNISIFSATTIIKHCWMVIYYHRQNCCKITDVTLSTLYECFYGGNNNVSRHIKRTNCRWKRVSVMMLMANILDVETK